MGAASKRLAIQIDVLDKPDQQALVLADLRPEELINAVLQEFREIEYLGVDASDYRLVNAENGIELEPATAISAQIGSGVRLRLEERPQATPVGATLIEQPLYLRETTSGRVFKVSWLPAIVGRTDAALPENNLVAVDLGNLPNGLRVSRRHVRITQEGDQIYVQCMSGNPATLRHVDGTTQSLDKGRGALLPGDVLFLERSEIALRRVVRIDPAPAESDPPTADQVTAGEPALESQDNSAT